MKVALYVGDHAGDSWYVRASSLIIRRVQKGPYRGVTHVEAIHGEHADGTTTIASSSLRDGGVRTKRVALNPSHWLIVNVPQWDVERSIRWFESHDNAPYDWRGAAATVLPGSGRANEWFCNEAVGASIGLRSPDTLGPHQFAAIAFSLALEWGVK